MIAYRDSRSFAGTAVSAEPHRTALLLGPGRQTLDLRWLSTRQDTDQTAVEAEIEVMELWRCKRAIYSVGWISLHSELLSHDLANMAAKQGFKHMMRI